MSGVITGSEEHKEKLRKQFLGQRGANTELTATSRRLHVATSPRRDVSTSRRLHVATSPRRDVCSRICMSSFNVRAARKLRDREAYDERHGFQEPEDPDFERLPRIRTVSRFC